jgi:hypothetical protein
MDPRVKPEGDGLFFVAGGLPGERWPGQDAVIGLPDRMAAVSHNDGVNEVRTGRPQSIEGETAVKHYAGIDVSLKESHVAVVDENGSIVSDASVVSEPAALIEHLQRWRGTLVRVGLEAGPLSQWLHGGLAKSGLPVVCLETRRLKAILKVQRVKSDRNDARGIAQAVRTGWYQPVHVKSLAAQERLALLSARKLASNKLKDVENGVRGLLRNFGIKLGALSRGRPACVSGSKGTRHCRPLLSRWLSCIKRYASSSRCCIAGFWPRRAAIRSAAA